MKDLIEQGRNFLIERMYVEATAILLFSIAEDTRKMRELTEQNQRYIEQTMKEMGYGRGNSSF